MKSEVIRAYLSYHFKWSIILLLNSLQINMSIMLLHYLHRTIKRAPGLSFWFQNRACGRILLMFDVNVMESKETFKIIII
jgi:hypothetical protein